MLTAELKTALGLSWHLSALAATAPITYITRAAPPSFTTISDLIQKIIFVGNSCTNVFRWWKALFKGEDVAGCKKCFSRTGNVNDASSNHWTTARYCCARSQCFKAPTPIRSEKIALTYVSGYLRTAIPTL